MKCHWHSFLIDQHRHTVYRIKLWHSQLQYSDGIHSCYSRYRVYLGIFQQLSWISRFANVFFFFFSFCSSSGSVTFLSSRSELTTYDFPITSCFNFSARALLTLSVCGSIAAPAAAGAAPPAPPDLPPFPKAERAARADLGRDFIWLFSASASWRSRSSFFMARSLSLWDLRNWVLFFSSSGSTSSELAAGGGAADGLELAPKTAARGENSKE